MRAAMLAVLAAIGPAVMAGASNCAGTSTGRVPLNDLGTGHYLGAFQGGLYPGGVNTIPVMHATAGLGKADMIVPRDGAGNPSPTGRVVLLSIGLSNTTQEFCGGSFPACQSFSFIGQAAASNSVNHTTLVTVDGAIGGQTPPTWDMPTDPNYDTVRNTRLAPAGVTEQQVQVLWIKLADAMPTMGLPGAAADAYTLERGLGNVVRACKARYPNLRIVYLTSRIYAGYATSILNPEPYAYESGFSVKWLIEAQIAQKAGGPVDAVAGDLDYDTVAPWLVWGPYPWADGTTARSDGLTWLCADFNPSDGTHPNTGARRKVGAMLLQELLGSPFAAGWFVNPCPADFNQSGGATVQDIFDFIAAWFAGNPRADYNGTGAITLEDIFAFLAAWFAGC